MTAYWLLVCHLLGDYVLQSDWMALEKTKQNTAAVAHAVMYTVPFAVYLWLAGKYDPAKGSSAIAFISVTHFIIDRWRLARYVCWLKNFLAPEATGLTDCGRATNGMQVWWHPWAECVGTGYHKDRPAWMAVWLMIIADNTMHLVCNGIAVTLWAS